MTDLKGRIAELERELERVRASAPMRLFEHVPDIVVSVGSDGTITGFNDAALLHFGTDAREALGRAVHTLFEDKSGHALQQLCASGFVGPGDSVVRQHDGRVLGFSISRIGHHTSFVVLQDRSQREQLEAELRYARRMASVGRLAAEVAHEINNPLAVIQGRLEMLKSLPEMPMEMRDRHLGIVEEHSQRVARIVQNLQIFARPRVPVQKRVPLKAHLETAVSVLGRRLGRVQVNVDVDPELTIFVDPDQGALVWENILASAAAIMPGGNRLLLQVLDASDDAVHLRVFCEMGRWSEEILSNLRSPYSGGRERIDPTRGLALTISWGIVQDHGGWMTAQNEGDDGASLELYFPGEATVSRSEHSAVEAVVPGMDVLVVDDDEIMAETVSWMLTTFGHRVVVVHSAEAALARLDVDLFHIILTDHRLPKMDGETMLSIVHKRWPEMAGRTVLTSGLLHRPSDSQLYIQKPFSREQLAAVLAQMVD